MLSIKEEDPLLSIVIVNWNSWEYLKKCIFSIQTYAADIKLEIIVIDNNSSDESVTKIQQHFPAVRSIRLKENLGFPKANNIGFALAKGKYILALNPDTEIHSNTLQYSMEFLEANQGYGCVSVKTLKPNGRIQLACAGQLITLRGAICSILLLDKLFPKLKFFKSIHMAFWDHDNDQDVETVQGAYMMFPARTYRKIGGFDERLRMFFEDYEFCLRLRKNGYRIRYLAQVKITHYVGQSTKKAVPKWIVDLRYESLYLAIKETQGRTHAYLFLYVLFIVLPVKLVLSPTLALGTYFKNGYSNFSVLLYEAIYGFSWVFKKIKCRYSNQLTDS